MRRGLVVSVGMGLAAAAGLITGCGGSSTYGGAAAGEGVPLGLVRVEVGSEHRECMSMVPESCAEVRGAEHGYEWSVYDWEIGGITLEEGTAYVLDVRIKELDDPPADASSIVYELVEIVEVSPEGDS